MFRTSPILSHSAATTDSRRSSATTITADALLTQRTLATYLLDRDAHDVFTVKDNQPTLLADLRLIFADRGPPDFREPPTLVGAIKLKFRDTVAATIQRLARNVRLVFDYLGMSENSRRCPRGLPAAVS